MELPGGIGRVSAAGAGIYVTSGVAVGVGSGSPAIGSAPAVSNDGSIVYVAINDSNGPYLVGVNATTLAHEYAVALSVPNSNTAVELINESTAAPMVAPDGTVFMGVFADNYDGSRGFMTHYSANLATEYTPGAFGWDDTASVIPASMVPSYTGTSAYLVLTKYNNYVAAETGSSGGNGVNEIAVLDPYATQTDPNNDPNPSMLVMKQVMTATSPTEDSGYINGGYPDATREWCTNGTAVDPASDSVFINNEDGYSYRWDLATNTITQAVEITNGYGEPYTPTSIGPNGVVYALNGGTLFALGGYSNYTLTNVSSLTPSVVGQAVTFTTTLASTNGGAVPTGSITYSYTSGVNNPLNSTPVTLGTVPLVNGHATFTTSALVPDHYHLIATYSGDTTDGYAAGSTTLVQVVLANPTTTLSASASPINVGASVTFTATVNPNGAFFVPIGTVSFMDGNTFLGTVGLNALDQSTSPSSSQTATFTTSSLAAGPNSITAVYSGDLNFAGSTSNTVTVAVKASPALATTPSQSTVTLGSSSVTLNDTATLSGGYSPTGTITFTLYQGSTLVDTETATVNGNGSYTTPTGYTLPTTGTVIGTYQWDATYNGDTYNNPASDNNAVNERVMVSAASPTIATTPNVSTVTLGTSSVTLNDTAMLSAGYHETGTITFTLFLGSTLVDTETATVNGNGSYTTPTGYTLPNTGTVTGTYQWDATYNGDNNNNAVSDSNAVNERVVVSAASPTIATTPNVSTVMLGTSSVTVTDTAALSGGYHDTGSITFTLYLGSTLVDTETATVSGNGSYTTPTGYTLPITGAVTGTYQWDANYNGDGNNNSVSDTNAVNERVVVSAASPSSIATTPNVTTVTLGTSSVTLNDTATLSGGYHDTGSITFTLFLGSTSVDTETTTVNGNGSYTTPTGYNLPITGTVTGTYQWDATYNGDNNNSAVSDSNAVNERVVVSAASPTIATTPNVTTVTLGTSSVTMMDTAVLSGGYHDTGSITFTLYLGSMLLDTETATVSGNSSYTTPTGYTLPNTGTVTGTYQWDATYNGDNNNSAVSDTNAVNERAVVSAASPAIATTPNFTTVTLGTSPVTLMDTAVLSGGYQETGSITFTLYLGSTLVDTETATVNGNGSYTTPTGYTLSATALTGTYQWDASYSGDTNNNVVSDNNASNERVVVSAAGVADAGFESPSVGSGSSAYVYDPTGSPWAYTGGAGVSGNSSGFTSGNPNAPQGSQVAFVQTTGSVSQSVTLAAGTYTVSFSAAQRANYLPSSQAVEVLIDGAAVGTITPSGTSYATYITGAFTVAAGSHTLSFVGLDPNGGDNTAFLDAVAITSVTPEPGAAVSENGTAVANGGTVNFGAAPGVPVTQTFTVTNTGTATLTLGSVSVIGTGFALSAPLGSSVLAPGASTTFSVQFSAASAGSYSGTVVFDTNDPTNTLFSFNLDGTV